MPFLETFITEHLAHRGRKMAETRTPEEALARFEELSLLETEFEDVELEIIRKSYTLHAPLWKKRADLITKIPHFWTLVFEQAPPEIDSFIQPSDSKIFVDCLQTLEVSRFEIDDPKGSPRSFSIKFGFGNNEYFEDKVLEKKFWWRHTKDWDGHVSEPVKIHWKKGMDPTGGLTDAAYELAQARRKLAKTSNGSTKSKETALPEYKDLAAKIEESSQASLSFFAWFAFVSSYRWISAEESAEASRAEAARLEKIKRGEKAEPEEEEEDEQDWQETEVFPQGDELAAVIAEDLWENAIRFFKHAHEAEDDDEDLSELSVEMNDEDDSDDEIDIRGLVGKSRNSSQSPPPKKQRNA